MHDVAHRPLAIVGMGCRLPGADNLDEYWKMLIEGRSGLGELPPERFNRELYYHPEKGHSCTKSYTSLGGIMSNRPFDRSACPLPQELIDKSHEAHLRLCEVAAHACRQAGMDPFNLPTRKVGVYVGHTPPSSLSGNLLYARQVAQTAQFLREVDGFNELTAGQQDAVIREIIDSVRSEFPPGDKRFAIESNAFHAAALITRGFNLDGPSMSFDAACASSLRAFGHAVRALQLGQIEMAIVGGASICHCDTLVLFSQAQSVSGQGSRPFDRDADGLVAAEGYLIVVIKPLEAALAAGDDILAVIRGVGISSDGKGKSLWAPRQEGQIEAVNRAYGPDVSVADLQYIEMHATSTQVGDATELGALTKVLSAKLPPGKKIPVGSVKANVGHTLESAGLASLVKTVLSMRNGVIPPQINITNLNDKIDWDRVPFYVPREATPWEPPAPGKPRRAAVNAFGIGGLNVHVVLDEYVPDHTASVSPGRNSTPAKAATVPAVVRPKEADEPIAIIGRGAVFPGARTIEHLVEVFRSGQDQRRDIPPAPWMQYVDVDSPTERMFRFPIRHGALIDNFDYDWKKHRVPPKQLAGADPLQFMLLDAADQAFRDAGYDQKPFDRLRTGAIVGTIFGGEFTDQLTMGLRLPEFQHTMAQVLRRRGVPEEAVARAAQQYQEIFLKRMPALVDETGSFTCSTLASRLTKTFDLMGGAVAVDAGAASAMAALNSCIDLLRAGDCDMMLCAAGQRIMGCALYTFLDREGRLAQGPSAGPFDAQVAGCVPGEAVGVVLLKRLSDAQRDGDKIHAIIRGIGVARHDSLHTSIRTAAHRALENSRLAPENVAVVETGAIGPPVVDHQELEGIAEAYGQRDESLLVSAVSAQFGYSGGAMGMASLFKAVTELNDVSIPKIPSVSKPAEIVTRHRDVLRLPTEPAKIPALNEDGRLLAGVDSYSDFNLAYHVIVEGATRVPKQPSATASLPAASRIPAVPAVRATHAPPAACTIPGSRWRIVRFGAPSLDELLARLPQAAADSAALFESAPTTNWNALDRARLAIVAADAAELAQKLTLAKQIQQPEARPLLADKGIFYGEPGPSRPRIALLFPGQGSQHAGMLKTLVEEFPPAADALRDVDRALAAHGFANFAAMAWENGDRLGTDIWATQLSLIAADAIMYRAVQAIGLQADRVAGHSFGELAALVAAESWSIDDAVLATKFRCQAIEGCTRSNGVMLSTSAPANVVQKLCREVGGRVFVSHRNAPDQTVAGGDEEPINRLSEAVAALGYQTKILPVPAAFHTPLMERVKAPFRASLETVPLEPPRIPLLSSVTNRYVADPEDIRDNLATQMTQPVNYLDLAQRLAQEGVSVFVEVGPKQVLTGLHKRIFNTSGPTLIACDHKTRGGLQQLVCVRACLETVGAFDAHGPEARPQFPAATPAVRTNAAAAPTSAAKPVLERHRGFNVLRLSGSPFEIGYAHGRHQVEQIRKVLRRYADQAGSKWDRILDIDAAVAQPEVFFGPDELEEFRGIAKGADVTVESVIAHNLRLYLDAGSGGIHFALRAEANPGQGLLHAANEDLQRGLSVLDCLERNIQVRRPAGGIAHVAFGVAGQVGCLNGINAAGLAVSTSALLDVPKSSAGWTARLHTVLVKNILERADNIDAALEILSASKSSGAWSLCISHHATDRLCYVEFDGTHLKVLPSPSAVMSANHRLLQTFETPAPPHSIRRLERLKTLLGGETPSKITPAQAQQILRDRFDAARGREAESPTLSTIRRVDNQISIVMQPAEGNLWITHGPLSNGHQNEFCLFKLDELLEAPPAPVPPAPQQPEAHTAPCIISADELNRAYAAAPPAEGVCSRFVLRLVEAPLPAGDHPQFHGAAIVLGQNAIATALADRLRKSGVAVHELPTGDDIDAALQAVDQAWQSGPALHLFLCTPFDADAVTSLEQAAWTRRRNRGVLLPYRVCQRWFEHVSAAELLDRASLVAATNLGDFGISGDLRAVECGALTGLVKGVKLELEIGKNLKTFRAKIVDSEPGLSPAELAEKLCRELAAADDEVEVAYRRGKRYLVRPVAEPVVGQTLADIPRGANFVITGGARGVTAVVARELGTRYGVKLNLIGSTPAPEIPEKYRGLPPDELKELKAIVMKDALASGEKPIEAWSRYEKALEIDATLHALEQAGVEARYYACNVADRAALAQVLDDIRKTSGPIDGVIHGAGFERASRFEKKQPELVDRTIAAKVDGAAALMELTQNDPVRYFAAFGSVSGRFGGVGQTDYCTANEMLAKLVDWFRTQRPECGATTFHWHAWDDVGMAVRPESQHIRKLHNIRFMPSLEGARHLIDELRAGLPEGEILITEFQYCKNRYAHANESAERSPSTSQHPLIDAVPTLAPGSNLVAEVHLDPVKDLFLAQHRFKGRPLMPVVVTLEALAEAASLVGGKTVTGLRNVEIQNGLRFHSDDPQTARLYADVQPGGDVACRFTCDFYNRAGKLLLKDKPYLNCTVELGDALAPLTSALPRQPQEWTQCWYPEEDIVIWHGPAYRCLYEIAVDGDEAWGRITAPASDGLAGRRGGKGWIIPAATLDSCFFACGIFLWWKFRGVVAIPDGVQHLQLSRHPRPQEQCIVHIRDRGRTDKRALYDFTVFGDDGSVILHVDGYQNVIVAEEAVHAV